MAAREKQDDLKTEIQAHTADVAVPADAASMDALEFVPDGGREAWTVVLGSTLALFASAGMINAYVSLSSPVSMLCANDSVCICRARFRTTTSRHCYPLPQLRRYRSSGHCKHFSYMPSAP